MKRIDIIAVLIFILLLPLQAQQDESREYGIISMDELTMTEYSKDKEAEALVLYDLGDSRFVITDYGYELVFTRTKRIKIFNDAGLDYAEVEFPLYRHGDVFEKVIDIEATTYNLSDGRVEKIQMDRKEVFDEKINDYWVLTKFALPNVRAGSVIEFKYRVKSNYLFNLQDWEFQDRIPTVYSEYTVHMVPFYNYVYIMQGASKFDVQNSYQDHGLRSSYGGTEYSDLIHVYGMKDIPAFRGEEFITSVNDYIMKLDFQLSRYYSPTGLVTDIMTTWEDMSKDLIKHEDFGKYITRSEKYYEKLISPYLEKGLSDTDKAYAIVDRVKRSFDWDGMYGKYASSGVKDLVAKKTGSVGEINLFLVGQLRAAGLDAHPVILSTRSHGKIRIDYPFASFFNYVVAAVSIDDGYVLLDATEPLCDNRILPSRCLNENGMLVNKESPSWINLQFNHLSEKKYIFKIYPVIEGNSEMDVSVQSNFYYAYGDRNKLKDDAEDLKEELDKTLVGYTVDNVKIENALENQEPYKYTFHISGNTEAIGDKLYISPFAGLAREENPLKQAARNYPIDFTYPTKSVFISYIEIPEGYELESIPGKARITNESFDLEYTAMSSENMVSIFFSYTFLKSMYSSSDYFKLKYYFDEIVKKSTDKVVLKKINIDQI